MQNDLSIEDQFRICRLRAKAEGWTIVEEISDSGISGQKVLLRPGYQKMMQIIRERKCDIILAESLDRVVRDQEHSAAIYKRVLFKGMKIWTLVEGEVNELHIGMKGTMGAVFLKDLAQKTHRGQRGVVTRGKSAGGAVYGYDILKEFNAEGERINRGEFVINEMEAAIVNRIFEEYVAGKSPKAIVKTLNLEGIPGPRGGKWGQSTINGNRKRGTGILNNELYVGRRVWNRQQFTRNPDTEKREARPNAQKDWVISEVPQLRIIDQNLWDQVRALQIALEHGHKPYWNQQRPKLLLSGLLKCGACGSGYAKVSKTHYGCSAVRNKGTCDNNLTIAARSVENTVINAVAERLMDPELCRDFCDEYTAHMNRLRMEHNASLAGYKTELGRNEREIEKLIDAIAKGVDPVRVKDRINALTARQQVLEGLLTESPDQEQVVLLHPAIAAHYHQEVRALLLTLNDPEHRSESSLLLRKLVDKVVLTPEASRKALVLDLHGDLAGILQFAEDSRAGGSSSSEKPRKTGFSEKQDKLVAGIGFEPMTFRL